MARTRLPVAIPFLSVIALLAAGTLQSSAANRCTQTELNQYLGMYSEAASDRCGRAVKNKNISLDKMCSACAADYKQTVRIDQWIAKHPVCATDLKLKAHSSLHRWMAGYKKACL